MGELIVLLQNVRDQEWMAICLVHTLLCRPVRNVPQAHDIFVCRRTVIRLAETKTATQEKKGKGMSILSSSRQPGMRVGALLAADNKVVSFLGYGTYDGDHPLPNDIPSMFGDSANPKITLDSGKVVWRCECWWSPEDMMKKRLEDYKSKGWTVVAVDIEEIRAKYAGNDAAQPSSR